MPYQSSEDPYALHPESIEVPAKTFLGALRRMGPALIIGAGVVGTGELMTTTVLGAENGYSLLWQHFSSREGAGRRQPEGRTERRYFCRHQQRPDRVGGGSRWSRRQALVAGHP